MVLRPPSVAIVLAFCAGNVNSDSALTMRQAMLCEVQARISWYPDKMEFGQPHEKDGAKLVQSKEKEMCAGDMIPVQYMTFLVEGVEPATVFNVMTDITNEKEWNPLINSAFSVEDSALQPFLRAQGVQAEVASYDAPFMFSDRQFMYWYAVSRNSDGSEFWLAQTSANDAKLRELHSTHGATQAQMCFQGYKIEKHTQGTFVTVTTQQNPHTPGSFFITPEMIFDVSWEKMVAWMNGLRKRAKILAASGPADSENAHLPQWMFEGQEGPCPDSWFRTGEPTFMQAFEVADMRARSEASQGHGILAGCLLATTLVASIFLGRLFLRVRRGSRQQGFLSRDHQTLVQDSFNSELDSMLHG